jgi:uncharacterized membrane protein YtjA (UPF0391 family)
MLQPEHSRRLFHWTRPSGIAAGSVHSTKDVSMLRWAMGFLVLAVIAALLGFGGLASASAGIAKSLFFLFLVIFLVTLALGVAAGRKIVK